MNTLTDSFGNGPKLPLRTRLMLEFAFQKAWFKTYPKAKLNQAFPAIIAFVLNHGGSR